MKRTNNNSSKFILLGLIMFMILPAFAQTGLKVGAAKVDITPDKSDLVSSTDMIRDNLYARAIYIDNGTNSAVLVAIDVAGVHGIEDVLEKSSKSTGCPVQNYVVTGTHTHSGNTGPGFNGAPTAETIANAIIASVDQAKANMAPARVGYGTKQVDLNVNRDNYDENLEWHQTANWDGSSDKTLSVISFLGEDDVPIAVYMNYAMHPVNFFMSGVISADFPGDATKYVEEMFDNKTVALFSQGAAGDQNPKMAYTSIFQEGQIKGVLPSAAEPSTGRQPTFDGPGEIPAEQLAARQKVIDRKSDYVHMLGTTIGNSAIETMLYHTQYEKDSKIWCKKEDITIPGRTRIDTNGRENYDPGYKDGPDVTIGLGLIQIGDINLVTVSGEVYSEIAKRLKKESPARKTVLVTLANGSRTGYIYSNQASNHLTFQVIGSNIKPGYAENAIVDTALDLMEESKL
nr:neutral/alkaline non-lysosomal ceramidase N-terminal domain-containing protein [uncultured Draconibacterium sp.]